MGMHYSIFVGPYLRCENPATIVTKIKKLKVCTNHNCKRFEKESSEKFCSECGKSIGEIEVEKKVKKRPVDSTFINELKEQLTVIADERDGAEEVHFWIRNVAYTGEPRRECNDEHFMGAEEIPDGTQAKEMAAFEEAFKKEINLLKGMYGEKNCTVRWGVLGDYS